MKYQCNCCGSMDHAEDMETIKAREKFCVICLTLGEDARASLRKELEEKSKSTENDSGSRKRTGNKHRPRTYASLKRVSPKKKKVRPKSNVFKCTNEECGEEYSMSPWNKRCYRCEATVSFSHTRNKF